MEINGRLKSIRQKLGESQASFAPKLGLNQSTYSKYELDGRIVPDDLKSKLYSMGVSLDWLVTGEGEMFRERSPSDEVGYYVEDLLDYDGHGNPFYDMIIEMMKTYTELDEKSQAVIRNYFQSVADGIHKEEKQED